MIREKYVPSVQSEMSQRWSKCMREVDGPSLIFTDFNVPALARCINLPETTLQLSENIPRFAICGIYIYKCHPQSGPDKHPVFGRYNLYTSTYCTMLGTGRSLEAPLLVFLYAWTFRLWQKLNFRSDRKELRSLIKFVENFNLYNLYEYKKSGCHVLSKAFSISNNTAAVDMLLLKFKVTSSVSLMHCSVVPWHARKPNWLALTWSLTSMCSWTICNIFSKSFPVVDKRLIGLKFWGNFGSLPDFSKVMIFVSLQDFGKCDNRRQWLNKFGKYISVFLGKCLR
jgi:hypothetical protein